MARRKAPDEVKLAYLFEGKPFKPIVPLQVVKAYEDAEWAAIHSDKEGRSRPSATLEARATFVKDVLAATVPDGTKLDLKLDARQIQDAWRAIWEYAFAVPEEPAPLV